MSEPNYDDLYFAVGDQSDGAVVTNTDRTQSTIELVNKIEMLEKCLKIAVKCLEKYAKEKSWRNLEECDVVYFDVIFKSCGYKPAQKALKQIKELDNGN